MTTNNMKIPRLFDFRKSKEGGSEQWVHGNGYSFR